MMNRRQFLRTMAAAAVLGRKSNRASASEPPNVIVFLADDQRWDTLGVYKNQQLPTPNIDRLGRQGVVFDRGYVTTSICPTSRASLLSGQYGRRHAIFDFRSSFSADAFGQTYPARLRASGYHVGFIGKYGIGTDLPISQFDFIEAYSGQGNYEIKDAEGRIEHLTHRNGDQALAFLAGCPRGRPFCLSISFKAPHVQGEDERRFVYDSRDEHMLAGMKISKPRGFDPDAFDREFPVFFRKDNFGRRSFARLVSTEALFQQMMAGYLRLIYGIDRAVGRILAELERRLLLKSTVMFYTSDNGHYFGEHGLGGKWFGHEPSIRVPLIMADFRHPRPLNLRSSALALNIDVAPTILATAGLPIPERMQGSDLRRLLDPGYASSWRNDFLYEHLFEHPEIPKTIGVVGDRYKYMRYFRGSDSFEQVFDLEADPDEQTNLVSDPSAASVVAALRERTDTFARDLV